MMTRFMGGIGALAVLILSGCLGSAATTAYYTLNPVAAESAPDDKTPGVRLVLGLGPLSMPDYLDRSAIVTRIGPNRLAVSEHHRWAGDLKSEILRVLAVDLEALTGARQVAVFPWRVEVEPDLKFRIDIQQFEGRKGGTVQLKAAWWLTPGPSDEPAVRRLTVIEKDVSGNDFDGLAAAMGQALADLSAQMADAVAKAVPAQ